MKRVLLIVVFYGCSHPGHATSQTCESASDCTDPALPYCVANACQACDATNGCQIDEPRCSPDTLTCVACVGDHDCDDYTDAPHCAPTGGCVGCIDATQCANPTPTCDQTLSSCRACAIDADCASRVCGAPSCTDASTVLYVVPGGNASATCEQSDPCSFAQAITKIDVTHPVIKLGAGAYTDVVTIASEVSVLIDGSEATMNGSIEVSGTANGAADVTIEGLMFGASGGIDCSADAVGDPIPGLTVADSTFMGDAQADGSVTSFKRCTLTILRSAFHSPGPAIYMQGEGALKGSQLTIDRSLFDGGDATDPQIGVYNGDYLIMTNSIMVKTAVTGSELPSILFNMVQPIADSSVTFSTLYGPEWNCSTSGGLIDVDDTIYVNPLSGAVNSTTGSDCQWHYSLLFPQTVEISGSENIMPPVNPLFVGPSTHDFHLMAGSPAIDQADPQATDTDDYDGTPRPQNGRSDIGAFEYKP